MPSLTFFGEPNFSPTITFAEASAPPGSYLDLITAAERRTRLADNIFSEDAAREEVYDRRIETIRNTTGVTLENPERGGYSLTERDLRQLTQQSGGPVDPTAYRRQQFEERLNEVRNKHPDQAENLYFGDVGADARAIARGAEEEYGKTAGQQFNPVLGFGAELAGGIWGMRRDPLFVGSMFAGPTTAIGRTVAARIATAGLFQGLYNAGLAALEQPAVQGWRADIGVRSGVVPAVENVGMAFLAGLIPGAALRGVHEAVSPPIRRLFEEAPQPGDIDRIAEALSGQLPPEQMAAIRLGESMDESERLTRPPMAPDTPEPLHESLIGAAERQADDPVGSPSAEGVAAVQDPERMPAEIADRVATAQPQTERDAQMAASEAIEDIGNREDMARTRAQMEADTLPPPAPDAEPPAARSKDPLDKIPLARDDGTPTLVSAGQAARVGERETQLADLVRECK